MTLRAHTNYARYEWSKYLKKKKGKGLDINESKRTEKGILFISVKMDIVSKRFCLLRRK